LIAENINAVVISDIEEEVEWVNSSFEKNGYTKEISWFLVRKIQILKLWPRVFEEPNQEKVNLLRVKLLITPKQRKNIG
jgi:hypothetical protein